MLIRLHVGFAGRDFRWEAGCVVDRPAEEALRLIARGLAEPVREESVEMAVNPPPERAVPVASRRPRRLVRVGST